MASYPVSRPFRLDVLTRIAGQRAEKSDPRSLAPYRATVPGAGLAERTVRVTVALRVVYADAEGVAAAVDRAAEGVAILTAILAVEAGADLKAGAVDARVAGAAAGSVAEDGARPAAAALSGGAGVAAGATVLGIGLEIGAHPIATRLPAGTVPTVQGAATAIADRAALAGLADGLRRAAVAVVADLVAVAGVIANPAVLRVILAVGALVTAADHSRGAALSNAAALAVWAAGRPATGIPGRAAHVAAAGLVARAALHVATADLTARARGPALPAGHAAALAACRVTGLAGRAGPAGAVATIAAALLALALGNTLAPPVLTGRVGR